jgi:uncharacterized protein YebE (UPF0316 family)
MNFNVIFSPQAWLFAFMIFCLRVGDMSLDTLRVLFVVRGKRGIAWVLGFFQSLLFVIAITSVLSHLDNPLNVLGYASGFATGNVLGMFIEERLAVGHIQLTIFSTNRGAAICDALRLASFGVTEIPGRGKNGTVSVILTNVFRKDVDHLETIILETDPEAFVTREDVRPMRRGFWRA